MTTKLNLVQQKHDNRKLYANMQLIIQLINKQTSEQKCRRKRGIKRNTSSRNQIKLDSHLQQSELKDKS